MAFEDWQKENEQLVAGSGFENWQRENVSIEDEETGSYVKQLYGSFVKGGMRLSQAFLQVPKHAVWLAAKVGGMPTELQPGDPLYERLQKITEKPTVGVKLAKAHEEIIQDHQRGMQSIIENHPEWEYNPPEDFLDLLTSPRKLSLIIAESTPVFIGAGIMVAGGRPDVGLAMMYAAEGQEAYNQAIADGATEDDASTAYHLYGSVASVIEYLQLRGIMKVGKGTFKSVLGLTTKKIAGKGLKSITKDIVTIAVQEAIEEIAQGTWQETVAKLVYDKSIPGGLWDFIDRRAQEGLVGFAMGVIPGIGGAGAAAIRGRITGRPAEVVTPVEPDVVSEVRPEVPIIEEIPGPEAVRAEVPEIILPTEVPVVKIKKISLKQAIDLSKKMPEGSAAIELKDGNFVIESIEDFTTHGDMLGKFNLNSEDIKSSGFITEKGYIKTLRKEPLTPISELIKPEPEPKPPVKLSRKKALALGHTLPEVLGWDDAQRRDFMQELVGKSSMKNMTPVEYRTVVEALQSQVREAGLEYVPEELPIDRLVETLERTKRVTELPAIEELNRGKIYKLKRQMKSGLHAFVTGLERMERFFEGLDGHKEGEFTNNIWKPIQQADELAIENTNKQHGEFLDFLESQNIDVTLWLGKTEEISGTKIKLTPFQKIGIYTLSQNKNSRRQLIRGMGFTEADISAINDSLMEQEENVANWLIRQYETQWPVLQQAAAQAGIDLTTLKKEFRYTPIVRTDVELDAQEDFLSGLAEPFRQDSFSPEKGMLEERKKKAYGRMEIDAAVLYMHNIGRVQRFIQMAPVAKKIGRILNNRKFKEALNNRTYGQGNRLVNNWMKDAVRGTITKNTSMFAKTIAIMRRNGILYAIGYNIPSSLRQTLSLSNATAVDPRMLEHVPVNIAKASTPSGYKTMEDFVYSHSLLAKTRSYDRDLRQKWNRENLRLKLRRKAPWSRKVMRWIRWMDRHTVVVAWKSLYDVGMQKFSDEQQAMTFADKWIGRTQPMANAKDLPDFFRGGTLERLLTTFQNQINNNGNFYAYDIIGAKTTKQISWSVVGYRAMFSWVLPAIMFGMIGRARPPKSIKELLIDLTTYPIAPVLLIGRWIDRMIRGWGQAGTVAEIGPEEFVKLGRAIGRWDIYNIIKRAATTIGALTGRIPAQAIRTVEGAIDYFAGKTDDLRRFIYSEWALKQGEPAEEEITLSRKR